MYCVTIHANIHVLGDASIAGRMPKSGFSANSQAKVCAAAVAALLLVVSGVGAFFLLEPGWKKARTREEVARILEKVRSGDEDTLSSAQQNLLQYRTPETVAMLAEELDGVTKAHSKTGDRILPFLCETLGLLGIREGAVEAHVLVTLFHRVPVLLADHQVAADVKQDPFQAGLDAKVAEAPAIELPLAVKRRHHDPVGRRLDRRFDEFIGRGQRA